MIKLSDRIDLPVSEIFLYGIGECFIGFVYLSSTRVLVQYGRGRVPQSHSHSTLQTQYNPPHATPCLFRVFKIYLPLSILTTLSPFISSFTCNTIPPKTNRNKKKRESNSNPPCTTGKSFSSLSHLTVAYLAPRARALHMRFPPTPASGKLERKKQIPKTQPFLIDLRVFKLRYASLRADTGARYLCLGLSKT